METLAADPQASVNAACPAWADTLAAYRFFDNPEVSPEAILKPHRDATVERIREHDVVLILQDTTELDSLRIRPGMPAVSTRLTGSGCTITRIWP